MSTLSAGIVASDMDNVANDTSAWRQNKTETPLTTVTLAAVLQRFNAPNDIDYLSLDVEGAEALVLQDFDFKRYRFRTITVERPTLAVHTILVRHGYWWCAKLSNFGEHIYRSQHLVNFDAIMRRYGNDRANTVWERPPGTEPRCQYADHPWIRVPVGTAGGNHSNARAGGLDVLRNDVAHNVSSPAPCVPPPPPTPKRAPKTDVPPRRGTTATAPAERGMQQPHRTQEAPPKASTAQKGAQTPAKPAAGSLTSWWSKGQ